MARTTAFTIILGVFAAPALAAGPDGTVRPVSLKDAPVTRNVYRHAPATATTRYICYGDGLWPRICDVASNKPSAPEKRKASGAR